MVTIIGTHSGFDLARSISNQNRLINTYELCLYEKQKFANGEFTVNIKESVRNKTVVIVSCPNDYEDVFEILAAIDAAKRSSAKEIIALIPMLPMSRQERRGHGERTSITARMSTAIEGFYNIPFDNIMPDNVFIDHIESKGIKNPIVVAPDFGATKRNKLYANELHADLAIINKERVKANHVSDMQLIGDVKDRDVIIFDDIIDTGGTLRKASALLKEKGAKTINIYATHGIFSKHGLTLLRCDKNIDNVCVTNSLNKEIKNTLDKKFLTKLDVSLILHNAIQKIMKS